MKNQAEILQKLGIEKLTPMQEAAQIAILENQEVVLLSPTGSGKTLAFLLPIFAAMNPDSEEVQTLVLVPSRELAIQIGEVSRNMGTGFKTNALYGGRSISKDKLDLKHPPALLIGTPGRIADHLRRGRIATEQIHTLVLDEFDKSLEIGFEEDMKEILAALPKLRQKILTSATQGVPIPEFVGLRKPFRLNFLEKKGTQLSLKTVMSHSKDKLPILLRTLCHLGDQAGIVFCNFRDSIQRVSDFLHEEGVEHGCFHGGMEQQDRERALLKFRNGTYQLLLATDLAARGIDIPEINFIIHYHLPNHAHEFTHRNGRTARMNRSGYAYVLQWEQEFLPDYIQNAAVETLQDAPLPPPSPWATLFLSGGRKDSISKGDIVGLCLKQGKLDKDQLGKIEIKQDCAFAAVWKEKVPELLPLIDQTKLKKKKIRVREV